MVDKEVLTDKQNESGYFMYFALNVRAPRDTTWLDSQVSVKIYCFIGLKKRSRFVKHHMRKLQKNYITRVQGE